MAANCDSVQEWVLAQFTDRLGAAMASALGRSPSIARAAVAGPAPAPGSGGLRWRQPFAGLSGALWIQASEKDWSEAGKQILHAAGVSNAEESMLRSAWIETLAQVLSALAQDFADKSGREIALAAGGDSTNEAPQAAARWSIQFDGDAPGAAEITVAIEDALLDSLSGEEPGPAAEAGSSAETAMPASKTFDLLLDVELPVSVSFGRAQVALKDVIKLTTGAIVELNRSITEPVEVIVNNCVIARGEVVVVEGNFGVRIREVISRQDRLRTLN